MFLNISRGREIYRARKESTQVSGNWYTLHVSSAQRYGAYVGRYRIKEHLKLINLLSSVFHKDFMERLTLEYPGPENDGNDMHKMLLLCPLGLPDMYIQNQVAKQILEKVANIPSDESFLSQWKTLNNISRFSEYSLDRAFAEKIKQFYGSECDGFILPLKCPSIPHGSLFHEELYIHDTLKVEYIKDIDDMSGGAYDHSQLLPLRMFATDDEYKLFVKHLQEEFDKKKIHEWGNTDAIPIKKRSYTRKKSRQYI